MIIRRWAVLLPPKYLYILYATKLEHFSPERTQWTLVCKSAAEQKQNKKYFTQVNLVSLILWRKKQRMNLCVHRSFRNLLSTTRKPLIYFPLAVFPLCQHLSGPYFMSPPAVGLLKRRGIFHADTVQWVHKSNEWSLMPWESIGTDRCSLSFLLTSLFCGRLWCPFCSWVQLALFLFIYLHKTSLCFCSYSCCALSEDAALNCPLKASVLVLHLGPKKIWPGPSL